MCGCGPGLGGLKEVELYLEGPEAVATWASSLLAAGSLEAAPRSALGGRQCQPLTQEGRWAGESGARPGLACLAQLPSGLPLPSGSHCCPWLGLTHFLCWPHFSCSISVQTHYLECFEGRWAQHRGGKCSLWAHWGHGSLLPSLGKAGPWNWLGLRAELASLGQASLCPLAGPTSRAGGEGMVPTAPSPRETQRQLGPGAAGTRRGLWRQEVCGF